jgi:nitrite reductase/ring-hydroxylating ferredoxin subunit
MRSDVCTHDGGPLSEGELETRVICPRRLPLDVRTGGALTCRLSNLRYEVRWKMATCW